MISIDLTDSNVTSTPKKGAFLASLDVTLTEVTSPPTHFSVWTGEKWIVFTCIKMLRNGRYYYRSDCGEMVATV